MPGEHFQNGEDLESTGSSLKSEEYKFSDFFQSYPHFKHELRCKSVKWQNINLAYSTLELA